MFNGYNRRILGIAQGVVNGIIIINNIESLPEAGERYFARYHATSNIYFIWQAENINLVIGINNTIGGQAIEA